MTPRDRQATAKLCATYERQQRALETLEWWATKGDWQSLVARLKTRELVPGTAGQR